MEVDIAASDETEPTIAMFLDIEELANERAAVRLQCGYLPESIGQ